jgi:molybdopterin converting factor small subunit
MNVLIPSPLRSYTADRSRVEAEGSTLGEVLHDLDRQFPGIRFRMIDEQERMRRHVRFFVNGAQTFDLETPVAPDDEVFIVQALSGG